MKILNSVWVLLFLVSCDLDRNQPGYSYFPDMEQSRSYETYSENPVLPNGKTNLPPVENTVPRGSIPYQFEKTLEDRELAGVELSNFYAIDSIRKETLTEGKRLYNIFCWHCHGEKGDGKGYLFTSGKYSYPPANLLSEKVTKNPDGEIFHVISVGFGVMGAHQGMVTPDERWKITSYIRKELIENIKE